MIESPYFRIGELGAAVIDTTAQEWAIAPREVNHRVLEQTAKDALAYPEIYGEMS